MGSSQRTDTTQSLREAAIANLQEDVCTIVEFLDTRMILLPGVFPPIFNTPLLATTVLRRIRERNTHTNNPPRVLEMGTGSGAAIVWLAMQEKISASATDISPMAACNCSTNAIWHSVQCTVGTGDLFEPLSGCAFDLIFWNVPFLWVPPPSSYFLFRASFDDSYASFSEFLASSHEYLAPHNYRS